jgi:hypothetical protein
MTDEFVNYVMCIPKGFKGEYTQKWTTTLIYT